MMKQIRQWSPEKRRRVGTIMMVAGIIPWLSLLGYIVYIRTPHVSVLVIAALAWAVFFAGKTLTKTVESEVVAD